MDNRRTIPTGHYKDQLCSCCSATDACTHYWLICCCQNESGKLYSAYLVMVVLTIVIFIAAIGLDTISLVSFLRFILFDVTSVWNIFLYIGCALMDSI